MITSREELEENLRRVRARIEDAATRARRRASEVSLVAITKEMPVHLVSWASEAGVADFGENYVNELAAKRGAAHDATWHYVGPLQSHTAHKVADLADVVHSAVPGRALERVARRAASNGRTIRVLVQIEESGRHAGVAPEEAEGAVERAAGLDGVEPVGLMTLPPEPSEPEDSRPFFARLRQLRDDLRKRFPGLVELSMGMSMDYEIGVEEGATMVRVGTALFGARPRAAP